MDRQDEDELVRDAYHMSWVVSGNLSLALERRARLGRNDALVREHLDRARKAMDRLMGLMVQ